MPNNVSLSSQNQFTFTCPIFDAKTKMAHCTTLRELVWAGKRIEKRKGCQAAMKCGKCPAAAMINFFITGTWKDDHHGSLEPKEGKLHARILERIARVQIRESVLNECGVPSAERLLMVDAEARVIAQLKSAPGDTVGSKGKLLEDVDIRRTVSKSNTSKPAATAAAKTTDAKREAARTGDLSAAINA